METATVASIQYSAGDRLGMGGSFTLLDYVLFVAMLAISGLIGIYYGFFSKRKQNSTAEYILGNKEMSVIPVAASLIVSHVSGTTILGVPSDVYANGTQYVMSFICMITVGLSLVYIYIPVFYDLNCSSCFKYLEQRFDRKVRITASLVYTLDCVLGIPIVIYVPALAFNQVSGINIHYVTTSICLLCIFYTTLGGLRAVVWTDTIQCVSIMGAVIVVTVIGTMARGSIFEVFAAAERGGRLVFFDMDPNPLHKSTFWTVTIGISFMWACRMSANQGTIQRFLSLSSKEKRMKCVWIFCIGVPVIKTISCYLGLLIYSEYENCDPFTSGVIKKVDQILPYYTMNIAKGLPGLTGLFIAGIFAAALSSMSSHLNSLAGTIFEDIIKPYTVNLGEKASSNIMKIIVVSLGVLVLSLVFVVDKLGAILQLAYSVHGLTAGPLLGIFTIGMLSPKINTRGIVLGAMSSLLVVGLILVGAQSYPKPPAMPLRTDGCESGISSNTTSQWVRQTLDYENVPWMFRISFMYYTLLGVTVLAIVAYPVSIMSGECKDVDERLLAPFVRKKIEKEMDDLRYDIVPVDIVDVDKITK